VFPVNPNRSEIFDTTCFPDFNTLPEPHDHLVIFTPAETSIRLLSEGAASGARSATFYAAGFGEAGDVEGLALAAQLRQALDDTGMTIVGPNCMGVACGPSGFCSIPGRNPAGACPRPHRGRGAKRRDLRLHQPGAQ